MDTKVDTKPPVLWTPNGYVVENKRSGGERGIRTPDTREGMPAFEAGAINHSAISPASWFTYFILAGTQPFHLAVNGGAAPQGNRAGEAG
jgi:hypothetical protein